MSVTPNNSACGSEEIAAYLDGELDAAAQARLEQHLAGCPRCAAELEAERRLLRELDTALTNDSCLELPQNFAQVVAARAQSDLSGVRGAGERRRALRLCALLTIISFALLGGAALTESVFAPLRAVWKCGTAIFGFLGHALYDAGTGLTVISRGLGGHVLSGSRGQGAIILLILVLALVTLPRLIVRYHRARSVE
jgi:anti-sigma factor RsiW